MGNEPSSNTSFVQAIGELWATLLILLLFFVVIIFRGEIKSLLQRAKRIRFKSGEREVVLEGAEQEMEATSPVISDAVQQPPADSPAPPPAQTASTEEPFAAMIEAFVKRRFTDAEQAFDRLQRGESDLERRTRNEAFYLLSRYRYAADASSIEKLETLAEHAATPAVVLTFLAMCFRSSSDYKNAIGTYERALIAAISDEDRANCVSGIAVCKTELGATAEALELIQATLAKVTTKEAKSTLFKALADVHKSLGDRKLQAIALEKVVELNPTDTRARFDAAHAQSEAGFLEVSTGNYKAAIAFEPEDSGSLNNLGVNYQNLEMPIHAVDAYRRASDAANTLASANLAYLLLNAGFKDEAIAILDKAKTALDCHPNVGQAIAATSAKELAEQEKLKLLKSDGERRSRFYRAFADAYFTAHEHPALSGVGWVTENGDVVQMTMDRTKFTAKWIKQDVEQQLSGSLCNRGTIITFARKSTNGSFLSNALLSGSYHGLAYVSSDARELQVMFSEDKSARYFGLKRATDQCE